MPTASLTLDLLALSIAVGAVATRVFRYRRLRIDHVLLFCIGHAYYLSLSSLMLSTNAMGGTYSFVYTYFLDVSDQRRLAASVWSLLLLVAFLGSAWLGADTRRSRLADRPEPTLVSRSTFVAPATALTAVTLAVFVAVGARNRTLILGGYRSLDASDIQSQAGRGILSAVASATILSALFMLHVANTSDHRPVAPNIKGLAAVAITLPSIALLLAGGRLYVATCLVAIVVWYSHVWQPISRFLIIGAGAAAFVALTFLGSIRTGSLPDAETIGFYATSESVLTSISQGRFLSSDREVLQPLRIPKYLASDLSNAVPRLLLPGKEALRLDPEDDNFQVTSPLGATQLLVSSFVNFGPVGSIAVIALLAFWLSRLKLFVLSRDRSIWSLTYAGISASLIFSLFRDPYSISVVRWMFVNAVILPAVFYVFVVLGRRRMVKRQITLA